MQMTNEGRRGLILPALPYVCQEISHNATWLFVGTSGDSFMIEQSAHEPAYRWTAVSLKYSLWDWWGQDDTETHIGAQRSQRCSL